jgi:hypothetical protein
VIVRILIWGIFDSKTTIDELRETLPALAPPSEWIWSESGERFGVVAFGDELPDAVSTAWELIGDDPDVYEEFDIVAM